MDDCCSHCGAHLPSVRDAFCPECRADLDAPPVSPVVAGEVTFPPSAEELASDQKMAVRVAVAMSVGFYAILIGLLLTPESRAKMEEAFGQEPLGLPAVLFAGLLQTVLYLPVPRAFYHLVLIGERERREMRFPFGLGSFLYILDVDRRHPDLARSRRICLGSLGYFIAVVSVWIVYALALGI